MKFRIVSIVILITLISSCSGRRQAQLRQFNEQMMQQYWENQLNYDCLAIRSKIAFTQDGQTTNASLNIRMKKDSVLWASVGFMGLFEAARVLVTQDSVHMMNRLDNSYMVRSLGYLKDLVGIDADLREIQGLLIGNAPFEQTNYKIVTADSLTVLQALMDEEILNTIRMNDEYRTYRSDVQSMNRTESAHLLYELYKSFNGNKYPTEITAKMFTEDTMSKVELNIQSIKDDVITQFPFSVPKNYVKL